MHPKSRTPDCRSCLFLTSLVRAGIPQPTIDATCERMWLHRARRRQILYLERNRASHLYAVRSGQVKLARIDAAGREHVVGLLGPGDLFGLEALFETEYAATAETLTVAELCLVGTGELRRLMAEVPRFALDLARYLHDQLLHARRRMVALHANGARAKLAGYLLHELERHGPGTEAVPNRMTLRELGGAVGLSGETVCRALGSLRGDGIVAAGRGEIRVLDLDALRACAAH